jgi:simple sugar transport system substrate-binding protein
MTMRSPFSLAAAGLLALASLTACSQDSSGSADAAATLTATSTVKATEPVPAKFAKGGIHVSVVCLLSAGDYFEQWKAGAQAEAKRLNVTLDTACADGNNDKQALNLQQAVSNKADAVIVDHGFAQTIQPAIKKAVQAKIPVVAFDVDPGTPEATRLDQDDHQIAAQALGALKQDSGGKGKVVYVYVSGFAPLDRRNETWTRFKKDNPGISQVAQIGVVNNSTAASVADQAKAALQAHPDATAIFAPFDDFAKGAVLAVNELGLQDKVKVYGADVSTADIAVLTAPRSPWVATSATDPANVGRVAVRAAALRIAGRQVPAELRVPPSLITQSALRDRKITNIQQLAGAFPSLQTPDLARVPWVDGR